MSALWDPIFGAELTASQVDDRAWIIALCEVESALAKASVTAGLVDAADAALIADACEQTKTMSAAELGKLSAADGNPVIPLVKALRAELADHPAAASAVHRGATSQDILDTAAMLVIARAALTILDALARAESSTARLAAAHRDTPMAARTLLQQAVPTTFGAVAAGWGAGLERAHSLLSGLLADQLAVQLGGAGGTLAALHPHGELIRSTLAAELGLADPGAVWHAERSRIAIVAAALATAAGVLGKIATDVVLLAQTEVGEVSEGAGGGSSAMPHKHNPIAAVTARAAAAQTPALVSTLLSAMAGEHQRAAGAWHSEWQPLCALLRACGGAADRVAQSLAGLVVHADRMLANLGEGGGLPLAERVTGALTSSLGASRAREVVANATAAPDFRRALRDDPAVDLSDAQLTDLLDPSTSLTPAIELVDNYLKRRKP